MHAANPALAERSWWVHVTTYTYDTTFRLTEVTDEIGKETHYAYDAYGRKSSVE